MKAAMLRHPLNYSFPPCTHAHTQTHSHRRTHGGEAGSWSRLKRERDAAYIGHFLLHPHRSEKWNWKAGGREMEREAYYSRRTHRNREAVEIKEAHLRESTVTGMNEASAQH